MRFHGEVRASGVITPLWLVPHKAPSMTHLYDFLSPSSSLLFLAAKLLLGMVTHCFQTCSRAEKN